MASMVILDTDFLSYYLIGHPAAINRLESLLRDEMMLATTVINKAEMFYGAYKKDWSSKRLSALRGLFDSLEIIDFGSQAAEIYGKLRSDLIKQGADIGFADVAIASIALENDAAVVTGNVPHFNKIHQLSVIPFNPR